MSNVFQNGTFRARCSGVIGWLSSLRLAGGGRGSGRSARDSGRSILWDGFK